MTSITETQGAALPAPVPLWRQRNFRRFWAGQTISVFGDQVSLLALPLAAVLTLDASPGEMGLLTALGWLPHLLFSLFAGVWIDRQGRRRRIMIAADVGRAAILASVPVAAGLGGLAIGQLYAVTFLVGTLSVFFDLAYSSLFVAVVPRGQVVDANSKLLTSRALSYVGGPGLAGFLVQALTAPVAILADAASFVGSALLLRTVDAEEPPVEPERDGETIRRRLREGFAFVFGDPYMRAGLGAFATINLFTFVFQALFVLFATRELGLRPSLLGAALSAGAVGGVVGAVLAGRIGRGIGIGPAIMVGAVLFPGPLALVPLAGGPTPLVFGLVAAAEFLSAFGVMVLDVNGNSLNVLRTPHRIRARAAGTYRFVNYGVRPVGGLLGGALGATVGLRPTLWIGVVGALLGLLFLVLSPVRALREPPPEAV